MRAKISDLLLDYTLYPRHDVDEYNVNQIVEAIRAGVEIPPVLVERGTMRVVDGFHRVKAYEKLHGADHEIEVLGRAYASEADLFEETARLNVSHGRKLTTWDLKRCLSIADALKIEPERMNRALSIRAETADKYRSGFANIGNGKATTSRRPVALKRDIMHKRGQTLTEEQERTNEKLGGHAQSYYANQLILLIRAELLDTDDERLMEKLGDLRALLDEVL